MAAMRMPKDSEPIGTVTHDQSHYFSNIIGIIRAPPETLFSENRIRTKANEIMFVASGNWSFRRCP